MPPGEGRRSSAWHEQSVEWMVFGKPRREGRGAFVEGDDDLRIYSRRQAGEFVDGVVLRLVGKLLAAHDADTGFVQCLQGIETGDGAARVDEVAVTATVIRKLKRYAFKHDDVRCVSETFMLSQEFVYRSKIRNRRSGIIYRCLRVKKRCNRYSGGIDSIRKNDGVVATEA